MKLALTRLCWAASLAVGFGQGPNVTTQQTLRTHVPLTGCECVGPDGADAVLAAFEGQVDYGMETAIECGAWDAHQSYCQEGGEFANEAWCEERWCFVNPGCATATDWLGASYSLEICGGEDLFNGSKPSPASTTTGGAGCECLRAPELHALAGEGILAALGYSDDFGSGYCDTHDLDESRDGCNDPTTARCWCYSTWCFVNPDTCENSTPFNSVSNISWKPCEKPAPGAVTLPDNCVAEGGLVSSEPFAEGTNIYASPIDNPAVLGSIVAAVVVVVVVVVAFVLFVVLRKQTTSKFTPVDEEQREKEADTQDGDGDVDGDAVILK